jgi:HEPN domain-containing protein
MKLHESWLIKASNDLKSSKKLIKGDDPVLDTAIYHTQQCVEKALKGFLAFKNHRIEKTHDIDYLINVCSEYDSEFNTILEDAGVLNPYNILYRYPDIILEPELVDVLEAIKIAETIFNFVNSKIK